jgi:hypothetical protein
MADADASASARKPRVSGVRRPVHDVHVHAVCLRAQAKQITLILAAAENRYLHAFIIIQKTNSFIRESLKTPSASDVRPLRPLATASPIEYSKGGRVRFNILLQNS